MQQIISTQRVLVVKQAGLFADEIIWEIILIREMFAMMRMFHGSVSVYLYLYEEYKWNVYRVVGVKTTNKMKVYKTNL